ncbi:MAG: hypothetical protein VX834_05005 [Myxococcota bacterium]|nr:hypothetical protein [Myxococcota bacterium]
MNPRHAIAYCIAALFISGCAQDTLSGIDGDEPADTPCLTEVDCPGDAVPNAEDGDPLDDGAEPSDGLDNEAPEEYESPYPIFIGGEWQTEYHLDWSEYLGPLSDLSGPFDMIDQILVGHQSVQDIPLVGPLIQEVVDNYIPGWIADLVHILNGIVQFFQDVQINGVMELNHVEGDYYQVTGNEDWQKARVTIIDGCPYGLQDPGYPACSWVDVPLNQYVTDFGIIGAEAEPFSGSIQNEDFLDLPERRVRFQISQLVTYILNYITNLASQGQYPTLASALQALIDCNGLAMDVGGTLCSMGLCGMESAIESACVSARDDAIGQVMGVLSAIMVEWEIMTFDQSSLIYDDNADGRADRLGEPPSAPGEIANGGFEVVFGASMDGTWWADRP